jgi:SAM-dependent methyltransferase
LERKLMNSPSTFAASDGGAYEIQMGRWSRRLAEPFLDFAGTAVNEEVLDVGCGTGNLAFAVRARADAKLIKGLDFSEAYVDSAARRNTDPRIIFEVGDASAMPYADGSFDRVLSMLVLFFVSDAMRAVAEMKRVARQGATVAAALWDLRGGMPASRMFQDTAAMLDPRAVEMRAKNCTRPLCHPGELGAAWRDAGFLDVQETNLTIRMEFKNFEDYWAPFMSKQGPGADYVARLTPQEQAILREHVMRAYLDGERDGYRSYFAVAHAVKGIK